MGKVSPARAAEIAERQTLGIRLRNEGKSWDEIAAACGHSDKAAAYKDVQRALVARREELGLAADEYRELALAELDALAAEVWAVLRRDHLTVSHGRVITIKDTGSDEEIRLKDDGPTLAAVDRLLKINERRARLLGLDSPVKVDTVGTVRYVIEGVNMDALR